MRIDFLEFSEETDLHIWSRHRVSAREVEDVVYERPCILRGRSKAVYMVLGRTAEGRYLTLFVRYLGNSTARLITARDMTRTDRHRYERQTAH